MAGTTLRSALQKNNLILPATGLSLAFVKVTIWILGALVLLSGLGVSIAPECVQRIATPDVSCRRLILIEKGREPNAERRLLSDIDTIMAHRAEPKLQRMQTRYRSMTGELLTLRQVAQNHGQSVGLPQMVGTPTDVADQLEAYFDFVGGDGFMLSPIYCPGAIESFVDEVVPELQRRGRMRTQYTGSTLRDVLRQED